ncbi:MAG: hypothetical protein AMXMBFR82_35880 [Candidatus Hydrogenedentota bacterium]
MNSATPRDISNIVLGALIGALAPVLCLAPFVTRAFHIDDPMYIWTAQHLHANPFDFYGFDVNWDGFIKSAAQENKNPPLVSYYMAVVAAFTGWSELALHAGFLIPAAALGLGIYFLAKHFCSHPVISTLIAIFTPAVLVSGSSVMSDVPMLTLFVWAIILWLRGLESDNTKWLFAAGFAIAAAALTKYFGIALVPLLAVYTASRLRKAGWWIAALAVPVLVMIAYEWVMWFHYGTGGLLNAAGYAGASQTPGRRMAALLVGLTFTGGCMSPIVFFAPLFKIRYLPVVAVCVSVIVVLLFSAAPAFQTMLAQSAPEQSWWIAVQAALFATAGLTVMIVVALDWIEKRDADSTLLVLWVLGTFVFSVFLNWSVTSRTILPMVPPVAILIVRRLEMLQDRGERIPGWHWYAPLVPSLILALAVAWADARLANSARDAAQRFGREMAHYSHNVYFQGHWGFQYYLEVEDAEPVAYGQTDFRAGDAIINPINNTSVWPVDESLIASRFAGSFSGPRWITTMSRPLGAGFYTDLWGPLPFAFGPVPEERYVTLVLNGRGIPFENVAYHE